MRLIDQKTDEGCFQACLASLLGAELGDIPEFSNESWATEITDWLLAEHGLQTLFITVFNDWLPYNWFLKIGKSPRGECCHAVISRRYGLDHDPHPSREGLETVEYYVVFIPLASLS